jgi:NAD(P)-dependent dehydrogenase (short-subunit alcohol dehydrogenase family)
VTPGSEEPRVAVVTGASRGLGAVIARFLAGDGCELVLMARDAGALDSASRSIERFGTRVHLVAGDVSVPEDRRRLRTVVESLGGLDLLVNNASELGPSPLPRLSDFPIEELERIYRVNLIAPVALVQLLGPYLARRNGLVVNISSDAAIGGYPGWGGYGASKAALDLVSRTLANELKESGIRVVAVDPGDMRTAMHQRAFPGENISDRPEPEVTLPFWAWLFGNSSEQLSGQRFRAQAERWEVPA